MQSTFKQYKELIEKIKLEQKQNLEYNQQETDIDTSQLIDIAHQETGDKPGFTPEENRDHGGMLNPSESVLRESWTGDKGAIQIQMDYYKEELEKAMERRDNTEDPMEVIELEERIISLRDSIDEGTKQKEKEDVQEQQQEEDISRYKKFKEYVKKTSAGVGSIVISLAGILTTVLISGCAAIYKGVSVVDKLAKAVYNTFKKIATAVGPYLGPIFTAVGGRLAVVLKYGAKGLAWLAQIYGSLQLLFSGFCGTIIKNDADEVGVKNNG